MNVTVKRGFFAAAAAGLVSAGVPGAALSGGDDGIRVPICATGGATRYVVIRTGATPTQAPTRAPTQTPGPEGDPVACHGPCLSPRSKSLSRL